MSKRRKTQARATLYFAAVACIVGGGLMTKFVEPTSGAALVAAGSYLLGLLGRQIMPTGDAPKADKDATPGPA